MIPFHQHQNTFFCQRRRFDQDCPGLRQVEMNGWFHFVHFDLTKTRAILVKPSSLTKLCAGDEGEELGIAECKRNRPTDPGIRVTLTLRGSKIAWARGVHRPETTPIASFCSKGLRKNTEVWLLPSIVVKSDTPPPPSIETSTRNKGHRSKITFMSTQYRTHAKWLGIAGDARRERALSPHVFRHFLHFFLVEIVLDIWNNGS